MRVAAAQFAATTDVAANLARIEDLFGQAAESGVELLVLPEGSMHDFGPIDLPLGPVAQSVDGPFVAAIAKLASSTGTTVVAGMFETSEDPTRPYNTLVAVDPAGELVACYRKAHLYDSFGYRESDRLLAGPAEPIGLEVGGFSVGLMTCYDVRFPEFARSLVDAGSDLMVVPAAWVKGPLKEDHWETLLRARAIENTAYVIGAGQTGRMYVGSSMVVDPAGVALAKLGDEEGLAVCDVSLERLAEIRVRNPSLVNRRL